MKFRFGTKENNGNDNTLWWIIGIIIVVLIIGFGCWCTTDNFKQTFGNIFSSSKSLKELDITLFMSPTCPWCQKTMEMLDREGVKGQLEIIDITKPEGQELAAKYGADKQPIPSFISKTLKTGAVGYRESTKEIIDALSKNSIPDKKGGDNSLISQAQQLQIILFARDGCSHCAKAKENCSQTGVIDVIQVVDITTPEGQELAGKLLPPGTSGVPAFVSMATKKSVVGFKPIDQIIQQLS